MVKSNHSKYHGNKDMIRGIKNDTNVQGAKGEEAGRSRKQFLLTSAQSTEVGGEMEPWSLRSRHFWNMTL